jgi:hypothetical protein
MRDKTIDYAARVCRKNDLLSSTIDGQVVITSIEKGSYIGLEGAGNRIWALIDNPVKVSTICDTLLDEYEVSRKQCKEEVIKFLAKLKDNNLIEVQN